MGILFMLKCHPCFNGLAAQKNFTHKTTHVLTGRRLSQYGKSRKIPSSSSSSSSSINLTCHGWKTYGHLCFGIFWPGVEYVGCPFSTFFPHCPSHPDVEIPSALPPHRRRIPWARTPRSGSKPPTSEVGPLENRIGGYSRGYPPTKCRFQIFYSWEDQSLDQLNGGFGGFQLVIGLPQ